MYHHMTPVLADVRLADLHRHATPRGGRTAQLPFLCAGDATRFASTKSRGSPSGAATASGPPSRRRHRDGPWTPHRTLIGALATLSARASADGQVGAHTRAPRVARRGRPYCLRDRAATMGRLGYRRLDSAEPDWRPRGRHQWASRAGGRAAHRGDRGGAPRSPAPRPCGPMRWSPRP